jgi:CRISPR/Cas system-associated exonuclease Cas4 (RecB family)
VEKFRHYLRYTGKFELSMLEADRLLGKKTGKTKKHEFLRNFPIQYKDITIQPNPKMIGINSPSKPDFLIPDLYIVGDVKSGKQFEECYRLTCAGYALAYENQQGKNHNIDFGIIYFLGTHTSNFYVAQTYLFLIDDELRREFLDKRNDVLNILASGRIPDFVERDQYCIRCKYLDVCDTDRGEST